MKNLGLFLVLCTLIVNAQEIKPSMLEQMTQPKFTFQSDYLSNANFEGFNASVKTYKQQFKINNEMFGFSYNRWDFDWDNASSLPFYKGKTPIDAMQRIKLYANVPVFINDDWFMLNAINVNATYEKEYSNSFGAGLLSFLSYKVDEEHAIQMGAFANYHPVKTLALPVLGYTYRIRETDGLSLLLGFPRAYVGYHINEDLLLNAGMIYSQAIIRLADDSGIEEKGYVEAKDYQANVGVRYALSEHLELSADLLYTFKRDFTIFNHDADELESYGIDSSAGVIVKLKYLF
ncbi:MAG: Unknown protein [uncultured Sulfurovum sp.]|uniref:Outer membrane protein beta-barrel domain-containing protein n=1 Tax=uncultured Sulfurovum sp. TaxID=269237 RepID=A0A6S6U6H7_9BACT|nr:MAG: Unknown protein [uncultured Sulfurovum sp.]